MRHGTNSNQRFDSLQATSYQIPATQECGRLRAARGKYGSRIKSTDKMVQDATQEATERRTPEQTVSGYSLATAMHALRLQNAAMHAGHALPHHAACRQATSRCGQAASRRRARRRIQVRDSWDTRGMSIRIRQGDMAPGHHAAPSLYGLGMRGKCQLARIG